MTALIFGVFCVQRWRHSLQTSKDCNMLLYIMKQTNGNNTAYNMFENSRTIYKNKTVIEN